MYLERSYRNALIKNEEILIEIKKSMLSGNNISDNDLRKGVDVYLTEIMEKENPHYRNRILKKILRDLTDRGPTISSIVK